MKIVVEGNVVKIIEEKLLKTCSTQEFAENLAVAAPIDSGILPKNTILYRRTGKWSAYVVELPQREVSIRWHPRRNEEATEKNYRLSLPFLQFYCAFNHNGSAGHLFLSCTKTPVKSLDDRVFLAPLPNQFSGGHGNVCTGDISFPVEMAPNLKMEGMVQAFFTNAFNDDLSVEYPQCLRNGGDASHTNCLERWAELSKANKMYGISEDFKPNQHSRETVRGMIDGMALS